METEKLKEVLREKEEEMIIPLIKRSFSEGHITPEQHDELIEWASKKKVEETVEHGDIDDMGGY